MTREGMLLLVGIVLVLAATAARAQVAVETTTGAPALPFEITTPGPASREATRSREADFYREDVRVRHEPAFIEPLTSSPRTGRVRKIGLSGWTSPPVPGGAAVVQSEAAASGWFGFGFTLVWE